MPTLNHYLVLSAILFAIGTAGVFLRRNLITILLSIEIMLNAVNLTFVAFGRALGIGRRPDHRVLRHDRRRRRGRGRPGDRDRAVPAPRVAQPRRVHGVEVVTPRDAAADSAPAVPRLPGERLARPAAVEGGVRRASPARAMLGVVRRVGRGGRGSSWRCRRSRARSSSTVFTWIASGDFRCRFALRLDPLSAVMILVVTGIGSLIHIYSTAYMHEETRRGVRALLLVPEPVRRVHAGARARRRTSW